jgi:hypothetical protein
MQHMQQAMLCHTNLKQQLFLEMFTDDLPITQANKLEVL